MIEYINDGSGYQPGVCNIGPAEIRRRRQVGWLGSPLMDASDDYCEFCDLPRSQCVHGRPPATPAPAASAPKPRKRPPPRSRPAVAAAPVTR